MSKNKNSNHYRNLYANLRDKAIFSFKFDLRKKNDEELTRGQRNEITRANNQYNELINQTGGMPIKIIKPRRLPKESDYHYEQRLKKLKKSQGNTGSKLNVIGVPVVKGDQVKIKGDKVIKERQLDGSTTKIIQNNYPLTKDDKVTLLSDPQKILKKYLDIHLTDNPEVDESRLLIGLDANGYVWKMGSVKNLSYISNLIYADIVKYGVIGDANNVIGNVIFKEMKKVQKKGKYYEEERKALREKIKEHKRLGKKK